jgi:hypothetical protein
MTNYKFLMKFSILNFKKYITICHAEFSSESEFLLYYKTLKQVQGDIITKFDIRN